MHTFRATSRNLQAFRLCKKKNFKFYEPTFWTKDICFYLDDKRLTHKL